MRLFTPLALLPVLCSAAIIGFCQMNSGEKTDRTFAEQKKLKNTASALAGTNAAPAFDPAERLPGGITTFPAQLR